MKKKLPLELIKGFRPQENPNFSLVNFVIGKDFIVHFIDNDEKSDFFFDIIKSNQSGSYLTEYKPFSRISINKASNWFTIEKLNSSFNEWISIINEYNNTEAFIDDHITSTFAEEFYNEFKFTDLKANYTPFSFKEILYLEDHLKIIENGLNQYKSEVDPQEFAEIINEVEVLKKGLTSKPKNLIVKQLAVLWAKLLKNGVPIVKDFLKDGFKEAMKIGIKALLE